VKEFLSREGVPFTAHDIDEDDRAYDDLIARGFRTVPVTVFNLSSRSGESSGDAKADRTITGFDAEALSAAVAEWRATFPGPSQS
jgi:glutaredoxin